MLMSLRLQKLHVDSLVVLHWMVFHKTRPFVKRKNTEFTNISSFTSLLMWSTHYTLFGRILLFSLPTSKIISTLYILKSLESLPGGSCLGPLGVHFSVCWRSSELNSLWFWTYHIQDFSTLRRKFMYFTLLFIFGVLYTKNKYLSTQFSRYNTTFFFFFFFLGPFYSFP